MALSMEVDERRKEIRTDGYPMSISEWVSLYENDEIDIHPEFQRIYRWNDTQKTNLIESLLLGIPIPSIFVSQREDGVWDVVDGLQRLSTIFQFMGILKDDKGELLKPLELKATEYLPGLQGMVWKSANNDDVENENDSVFTQDLKLLIKRTKLNVSIILKESDDSAKYDLFQRLNTGGSNLSPQEVRNCILVMINTDFYEWLRSLSEHPSYQECISLSERPLMEAYDMELALRFIIFSLIEESDLENLGDVGVYVTEKMREIASSEKFEYQKWEKLFKDTFDLLAAELSDSSFKRFNKNKNRFMGGFLLSQYEVIAYGIGYSLYNGHSVDGVSDKAAAIWSDSNYTEWSGSGMTASRRLPKIIPYGREVFSGGNKN